MPQFVRFTNPQGMPEIIEPNTVRAVLSSSHGPTQARVVIDGGTKVEVQGSPLEVFEALSEASTKPLSFWVAPGQSIAPQESPTLKYVDAFAASMEARLEANRHKGDREGWLGQSFDEHLERLEVKVRSIQEAFLHASKPDELRELGADAANRLMMMVDVYENPRGSR